MKYLEVAPHQELNKLFNTPGGYCCAAFGVLTLATGIVAFDRHKKAQKSEDQLLAIEENIGKVDFGRPSELSLQLGKLEAGVRSIDSKTDGEKIAEVFGQIVLLDTRIFMALGECAKNPNKAEALILGETYIKVIAGFGIQVGLFESRLSLISPEQHSEFSLLLRNIIEKIPSYMNRDFHGIVAAQDRAISLIKNKEKERLTNPHIYAQKDVETFRKYVASFESQTAGVDEIAKIDEIAGRLTSRFSKYYNTLDPENAEFSKSELKKQIRVLIGQFDLAKSKVKTTADKLEIRQCAAVDNFAVRSRGLDGMISGSRKEWEMDLAPDLVRDLIK